MPTSCHGEYLRSSLPETAYNVLSFLQIVRVQGKDGTKRITVAATDTVKQLKDKVE